MKDEDETEVTIGHAHRIKLMCMGRNNYEHSKGSCLTDYSDHSNMLAFHFSFTINIRKYYSCKYVHALILPGRLSRL